MSSHLKYRETILLTVIYYSRHKDMVILSSPEKMNQMLWLALSWKSMFKPTIVAFPWIPQPYLISLVTKPHHGGLILWDKHYF